MFAQAVFVLIGFVGVWVFVLAAFLINKFF